MCWKYEWARAVNDLSRAVIHVERARRKIRGRLLRNERTLRTLSQNKKYNYPALLTPVRELIEKNDEAERSCRLMINHLRDQQGELRRMIKDYGIRKSSRKSRMAEKLMRGRRVKAMVSKSLGGG